MNSWCKDGHTALARVLPWRQFLTSTHLYVLSDGDAQLNAIFIEVPAHQQLPELLVEWTKVAHKCASNSTVTSQALNLSVKLLALQGPATLFT